MAIGLPTNSGGLQQFYVGNESSAPVDVKLSSDGTKMYVLDSSTQTIYQYTLSTAFDVNTATYASLSFDCSNETASAYSFAIYNTHLYVLDISSDYVYQYTLTTGWNISTAGYDSQYLDTSGDTSNPQTIEVSPTGSYIYVGEYSATYFYQYPLSTAWDVSTAGTVQSKSFVPTYPRSIWWSSDGYTAFSRNGIVVFEATCSTAYDITSAGSPTAVFYVNSQVGQAGGGVLSSDGDHFYVLDRLSNTSYTPTGPLVIQYDLTTTDDISTSKWSEWSWVYNDANSATTSLPTPYFEAGDYLLILSIGDDDAETYSLTTWASESFTNVTNMPFYDTGGDDASLMAQYKLMTAADESLHSLITAGRSGAEETLYVVLRVTGADGTTFLDASAVTDSLQNDNAPNGSSIGTNTDGAVVINMVGNRSDTGHLLATSGAWDVSQPSGWTIEDGTAVGTGRQTNELGGPGRLEGGSGNGDAQMSWAYLTQATAGTVDPGAWGGFSGSRDMKMASFAIRPGSTSTTYYPYHTTDAVLKESHTANHTADAALVDRVTPQHTADATVVSRVLPTHTADAVLIAQETLTHTADAALKWVPIYGYWHIPSGASGYHVDTPDHADFAPGSNTDLLDFRAEVYLPNGWNQQFTAWGQYPSATLTLDQSWFGPYGGSDSDHMLLKVYWGKDSVVASRVSTNEIDCTGAERVQIRATVLPTDTGGPYYSYYYKIDSDDALYSDTGWTTLEQAHAGANATSMTNATADIWLGRYEATPSNYPNEGYIYQVCYKVAGTTMVYADARTGDWDPSGDDDQGHTWTLDGATYVPSTRLPYHTADAVLGGTTEITHTADAVLFWSDDFSSLDPSIWTLKDIQGDSSWQVTGGKLELSITENYDHNAYTPNYATWAQLLVTDDDIDVIVKLDSDLDQDGDYYRGLGLFFMDDEQTYIEWYMLRRSTNVSLFCSYIVDGTTAYDKIDTAPFPYDSGAYNPPIYIRMTRVSDQWTAYTSQDPGGGWDQRGTFSQAMTMNHVGLMTMNHAGTQPAYTAQFDYIEMSQTPIPAVEVSHTADAVLVQKPHRGRFIFEDERSANVIYTADKSQLQITGSIDLIALIQPWDIQTLTPSWSPGDPLPFLMKGQTNGCNYSFALNSTGDELYFMCTLGGTDTTFLSTVDPNTVFNDGDFGWVRVTRDSSTGDVKFYTGGIADEPVWTQLGSTLSGASGSAATTPSWPLQLGRWTSGTYDWVGGVAYAEVKNGIDGTTVAKTDFRTTDQGDWSDMEDGGVGTAVSDGYGNDWYVEDYTYLSYVPSINILDATVDAVIVSHETLTHTADAALVATVETTHTVNAVVGAVVTASHTADAVLVETTALTHDTDAVLRETVTTTHDTDAVLRETVTTAHTGDSVLRETITATHDTDALVVLRPTPVHTTDAVIVQTNEISHTGNAVIVAQTSLTVTGDAVLRETHTSTHDADAHVVGRITPTHTTDAVVFATVELTHTADAVALETHTDTHTADAVLVETIELTHSADAVTRETLSLSHTSDAILRETVTNTHDIDAQIVARTLTTHTADAVLIETHTSTHTGDAVLVETAELTHTADAVLLEGHTTTHTGDAVLIETVTATHDTDAVVVNRVPTTFIVEVSVSSTPDDGMRSEV